MGISRSAAHKSVLPVLMLLTMASAVLPAQEYSFRSYGISEGLNNLAIRRIYQDRIGFLWVSTENGIYRYDGDRFEAFGTQQGMPSNSGAAFGDAPDRSLLAGGDFGLYHLAGNQFEKISGPFKTISWAQGIQADGKGHTYLGTDAGLLELSSKAGGNQFAIRIFPQPPGTSDPGAYGIFLDGDVLWYGCGHQLCRMDAQGVRIFGQNFGLPNRGLQVIEKDGAGNLWVRARNGGIFVWPAGKVGFQRPALPLPDENMSGVPAVDSAGRILIPSPEGLLIGDNKGWQKIDRSTGLRGTIYAVFEDRQHTLWIGTAGRGLLQWRGYGEWESYSNESGLASDLVYEILPQSDGSLLVGTEAGLFRGQRTNSGISFKSVAGFDGFAVHSVRTAPNGELWIGTETHGVARIDARTGKAEWFGEAQGLIGKAAYILCFDREQRFWAGTESGLFMALPPYQKFSRVAELPPLRIWAIALGSDGAVWAGGAGGLFRFTSSKWKNLTHADGLSNQEVLSIGAGPNGSVWVGYRYGGGIDRVYPQDGGLAIQKGVERAGNDGLIYFLDYDTQGRLWAGTERGVDMWDGDHWSHYDTNDGLAWDDCNLNAFAEAPDGTVWIGTGGGLSRFKPLPRQTSDAPLRIVFTRLAMGNADISGLRDPSFRGHANSLVASYSALNALRQNGVIFRYRLQGTSESWTETNQRELQFANLAPGTYRLEVNARETDGAWSASSAVFPFRILASWYSTWWFAALCIVIPLAAFVGVLWLRFVGAQKREKELRDLVKQKTEDLQKANEELFFLSFTDPLTGLCNRRLFDKSMEKECARIQRMNSYGSLLSIDVDQFKHLNDSQGHQKGDECLVALGEVLTRLCRRKLDMAARCGGEEFAMILPITNTADAVRIAEKVREAVADLKLPHPASGVAPYLTVSVGVATATRDWYCTPDALVAAADRALYAAKKSGRNCVCAAPPKPPVDAEVQSSSSAAC